MPVTYDTVPAAALFLDQVLPGWAKKVTKPVVQHSAATCVVGQNVGYGKYEDFMRRNNVDGYMNNGGESVWFSDKYNAEWQFEVNSRKNGVVPAAPESDRVTILAGNSIYEIDRSFDGLMRLLSHLDVDLKERAVTKL